MEENLGTSSRIYIPISTAKLMLDVLIALAPALVVSVIIYGSSVLLVTGVAVFSCVLSEHLIQRYLLKGESTIGDCSAIVTGVLLAFNLPPSLPIWMIVLGALVAIGIGKMTFGGLGRNPLNPALVGRVFLLIFFPMQMTSFVTPDGVGSLAGSSVIAEEMISDTEPLVDAISGPTLLEYAKTALSSGQTTIDISGEISYWDMLLGFKSGSLGEIAALALLLGFVYLLYRKVITWHIPIFIIGSMALFSGILWGIDPLHYINPLFHFLTGGALLGAIFMATDPVTSPTMWGEMAVYGIGIGVITILIRIWGPYPEGISFAILIMNAVVPLMTKRSRSNNPKQLIGPKRLLQKTWSAHPSDHQ